MDELASYFTSGSFLLYIPSSYRSILTTLLEQSLDPEQIILLEKALRILSDIEHSPYEGASGRITVDCLETQAVDASHAILEGLTHLENIYEHNRIVLYTQNERRKVAVEQIGFLVELVHTPFNQDFHDLFWTTKRVEFVEHQQLSIGMHPTGIDPDKLWLLTTNSISREDIRSMIKRVTATYPLEAMFRNEISLSSTEISYALPKEMIQENIEKSDPEGKEFITSVYEAWIDNLFSWVEDIIEYQRKALRFSSILVTLKNTKEHKLHDITLTCDLPDTFELLKERQISPITFDIPKLPILTQAICSHIDSLPPETYLSLFGNDLEDCCLISPSYQKINQTSEPITRISKCIDPNNRTMTFTIEDMLPYEALILHMDFLYTGGKALSALDINYTLLGSGTMEFGSGIVSIQAINKKISILTYIEKLLEGSNLAVF